MPFKQQLNTIIRRKELIHIFITSSEYFPKIKFGIIMTLHGHGVRGVKSETQVQGPVSQHVHNVT